MKNILITITLIILTIPLWGQTELNIPDTRNVNDLPNFAPNKFRLDFKFNNVIGIANDNNYSTSLTISPWSDATGGFVHQLNFNDNSIRYRNGVFNGTWKAWRKILVENENGYVGIGTTNPTSKLTVAGDIRAREVKVEANAGADFVFAPDYHLRPLTEVEQFITANRHLPDIAPADSMVQNGVNMGEMQVKLLQKIEELTLYVIELKKENEAQQKEIEKLKRRSGH